MNNPRKKIGGKLEVRVKVRTPLAKPDIVVKKERWLRLEFGNTGTATEPLEPSVAPSVNASDTFSPPFVAPMVNPVSTPSAAQSNSTVSIDSSSPEAKVDSPIAVNKPAISASAQRTIDKKESPPPKTTRTDVETEDLDDLELQFFKYVSIFSFY
jgi:hypothetical protein